MAHIIWFCLCLCLCRCLDSVFASASWFCVRLSVALSLFASQHRQVGEPGGGNRGNGHSARSQKEGRGRGHGGALVGAGEDEEGDTRMLGADDRRVEGGRQGAGKTTAGQHPRLGELYRRT